MKSKISQGLILNFIYIVLNISLNFMLAPYIVEKLGTTAYGFNSMSDNFANYAVIITTALNHMGCRFIAYEYHRKNKVGANGYYSSLFYGDIILSVFLGLLFGFIVIFLENIIIIPKELLEDVRITFALTFLAFIIQIIGTAFSAGTYVGNRMDLYALRNVFYTLLKWGFIILLYVLLPAKIYYISAGTCVAAVFALIIDYAMTLRLVPDLSINIKFHSFDCIRRLISSGIWYSIVSLGGIIANGLDLIITNQAISSYYMGILAVSKTIVTACNSLRSGIVRVFNPSLIKIYAAGFTDRLVEEINRYIRTTSVILNVPLAGVTVFAEDLYKLWLPTYTEKEIELITILTLLAIASVVINVNMGCLSEVCALVNKLKVTTLINILENLLSLVLTLVLLQTTELGILAVAGVSSFISGIYFIFFIIPYMAKLLGISKKTFYPVFIRGLLLFFLQVIIFKGIRQFCNISTWIQFIEVTGICGTIGYIIAFFIGFKKEERSLLLSKIV